MTILSSVTFSSTYGPVDKTLSSGFDTVLPSSSTLVPYLVIPNTTSPSPKVSWINSSGINPDSFNLYAAKSLVIGLVKWNVKELSASFNVIPGKFFKNSLTVILTGFPSTFGCSFVAA